MPALVAFFVATITIGLMSRSMPQLNLMTVGIAVHLIVGFVMVRRGSDGVGGGLRAESRGDMMGVLGRIFEWLRAMITGTIKPSRQRRGGGRRRGIPGRSPRSADLTAAALLIVGLIVLSLNATATVRTP